MGKATKWFRGLLGLKNPSSIPPPHTTPSPKPPKRRWSFVKSYREKTHQHSLKPHQCPPDYFSGDGGVDPSKHAIAVAAATAAVADAAVKAAQAAAAVVRLTSGTRSTASGRDISAGFGIREEFAAIKIQSNFRAYLSRRALRALKALVKLQALVRGHIVRKQTADMLRRMHALLRAQARARSVRSQLSESSQSSSKSSHFHHHHHHHHQHHQHHPGPATPEKFEHSIRAKSTKNMLKRNGSKSYGPTDDEKSDKILEIDSGKNHFTQKRKNLFHSSHQATASDQNSQSLTTSKDQTIPSQSSYEVQSYFAPNDDEATSFCTAENSPRFYSASLRAGSSSSMRGLFTPKSDASRSCSLSMDHPSYMAYTESAKAKMRSLSAPRQRTRLERSNMVKMHSIYGASKAYPGSGRLDRLGMPVGGGGGAAEFSGGHWNRY